MRLAERLEVPLRDRNVLLNAAGFAPMYRERPLDHPEMASARTAVELILKCHEPYPALAMDRHWNLVAANRMVPLLLAGTDADMYRRWPWKPSCPPTRSQPICCDSSCRLPSNRFWCAGAAV